MSKHYFTFGADHVLSDYYIAVEHDTEGQFKALSHRDIFMDVFGSKFAFEYDADTFEHRWFKGCCLYIMPNNFGNYKHDADQCVAENLRHINHVANERAIAKAT